MVPRQRVVRRAPVSVVRRDPVLVRCLRQHGHRHALPVPVARRVRSGPRAIHPVARGSPEPVHAGALPGDAVAGSHVGALHMREVGHILCGRAHEPGLSGGARLQRAVGTLPTVAAVARVGWGTGADSVPGAGDLSRAVGDSRYDVAAVPAAPLFC